MKRYRDLAILLLALFLMTTVGLCRAVMTTASDSVETQQMQLEVADFNNKAAAINQQSFRPVQPEQTGYVQQDILNLAQGYGLEIMKMQRVANDETGENYQLDISGPWVSTANFLESFQAKDALLTMRYLSFEVVGGKVQTILQYKIYTK